MFRVSASEYKFELLNENDGFASSIIFSIVQDKHGFLWFGTGYDGIMRYDGKKMTGYQHDPSKPNSLGHNNAGNIILDKDNNLWIGSWGGGVLRYDQQSQQFSQFLLDQTHDVSPSMNRVQSLFEDQQGIIWLGSRADGLYKFNPGLQVLKRFSFSELSNHHFTSGRVWDITETSAEQLWVGTSFGLNLLKKSSNTFTHFIPAPDNFSSKYNKIRRILVDENNTLFLGTQDGVLLFDPENQTFTPLKVADNLSVGVVYSMIKTDFNEYWLSSDRGVFSFSTDDLTLTKVNLGFDDRCSQVLFQDRQSTIWLSCEGVGVYKISKINTFKVYENPKLHGAAALLLADDDSVLVSTTQHGIQKWNPATKELIRLDIESDSLTQPEVRYMTQTSEGNIWYADQNSVFKLDKAGFREQIYPTADVQSLFTDIKDIEKDEQDNIWLATDNGIFIVKNLDGSFEHLPIDTQSPPSSSKIIPNELYLAPNKRMWIGTNIGLKTHKIKDNKTLLPFISATDNEGVVEDMEIHSIFQDSRERLWVGTHQGLYLLNENFTTYKLYNPYFSDDDNREIRFIHEDTKGFLWLVTPARISKLNPNNGDLQHFDKRDGLPKSRYFLFPTASISDGTIYLPSRMGIYYFDPNYVSEPALSEDIRLTNLEVLGSERNYNIATAQTNGFRFTHQQNNLKFDFATMDLVHARQIHYSYKLDGFDQEWIENGNNSSATYTNLAGGDYTFQVRAAAKKDIWYKNELAINIYVATVWWQQWWMYLVYLCSVLLGVNYYLKRQKRLVIRVERQIAEKTAAIALESNKLAEANKIKTLFLANMSHEIRTPLTTVIGQAEAIICREVAPEEIYKEVAIIHDSGLYLLALLNDILDLTQIEENKFKLELAPQDLHELLSNINTMFYLQANVKGLTFMLHENLPVPFFVNVDGLRLKQILINLCSNALKFTPKGHVSLHVSTLKDKLVFTIEDSGIGISESQQQQIFISFTQGDSSIKRRFGGSGLGLYISNQLAILMGGTITVKSKIDHGSVFTFILPLRTISSDAEPVQKKFVNDVSSSEQVFSGNVLLAEDHPENRRLISRLLTKLGLKVFTANDGLEAIESYIEHSPDLVLLDIQMPNMDGIQAYQSLRDYGCTCPIIALTANAMSNEVEHYERLGFDGYLKKPLDRQLLIATLTKYFAGHIDEVELQAAKAMDKVDMSDLVVEFKDSLVTERQQFILHGENNDLGQLAKQSHRLCGAAQLFGFATVSHKAAQLETSINSKDHDLSQIKFMLESLIDEIEKGLAD